MIIDCFPFFNELDLLEIRLNELSDIVDVFCLAEETLTHSGKPKPLFFDENKDRFKTFNIEHTIIDNYGSINITNAQAMERGHKQIGLDAMVNKFHPGPEDIILLSDCDEIPKAKKVREAIELDWTVARPDMPLFYYYMNCQRTNKRWRGGAWVRPQKQSLRHKTLRYGPCDASIVDAGWHFSYLGDIKYKIDSISHLEYAKPPFNTQTHIDAKIESCEDLFDRKNYKFATLNDLSYLPQYVLDNMDKFGKYIKN